jgi:hypothetical protein
MIFPAQNLGHQYFCVEGGFCLRAVDILIVPGMKVPLLYLQIHFKL